MKCIFLHGLGQSAASWDQTVKELGQAADILCPELSEWLEPGRARYASLYNGLEQYCAQFNGPLDLCGLSLGGILALQYGIEHPDRVHSLVLIGTQYVMPKRLLKFQNALFRLMPKRAFRGMGFEKIDLIDLSKSMMNLDFRADLKQVFCPVLIVCGEKDRANKKASVEMGEQIPGARLVLIPGSGHEVNKDAPEELGKTIGRFLEGVDTAAGMWYDSPR